jgi:prolyl-tRNA editing enzyme YbaK/EbsC (Cys-tRNA(Pro) deacylase)
VCYNGRNCLGSGRMVKLEVINFFKSKNYDVDIITMTDSATVVKAANELGVATNDIAKTLSFYVNDKAIVIVMSGDVKIDNAKYKSYFNVKAKMIPLEEVENEIGHPVGGVCPFGVKDNVGIYLDESLKLMDYVYPAAGSFNTTLKIRVNDISGLLNAKWINVCKIIETQD